MNLSEYCWLTNINIFFMIFYQVQKPKVDVPHRVCLPQTSNPLRTVISIVPKNLDIIHIQLTVPNTMFACSVEHYWKVVPVVLCTVTSYVSASTTEWIFHCLFFNFCFDHKLISETCDWPRNVGCELSDNIAPSAVDREVTPRIPQVQTHQPQKFRFSSPSGPASQGIPARVHAIPPPPELRVAPNPVITSRGQPKFEEEKDIAKVRITNGSLFCRFCKTNASLVNSAICWSTWNVATGWRRRIR